MNDRFIEDLKSRVDIVQLIGKYTELKKSGKNFMCRSPFRNERTPSFSVSPDKQVWYDFGASEGGDAIRFLEKIENISFTEAIELMADMSGIEIPKNVKLESSHSKKEKKDLYALHDKAQEYFALQLQKSKEASDYVENRGYDAPVIQAWGLGYGGDSKDGLAQFLLKAGFGESMISQSGVAFLREFGDKTMMDRFWGRVMIPLCEPRNGEKIAFSGRDILRREKVGKYVNSPENPLYNKSATLFGLDKARKAIRDEDYAILVEGNFDVITMHQKGFIPTVATCGTSLTEDHLRILKRLTKNIILAFDNDVAGKRATLRGVEMCLEADCNPFILSLDEGKDLDEFLQDPAHKVVLQEAVKNRENALDFLVRRFSEKFLSQGIEGRKKLLDHFFYFLQVCPRPIEVDHFLGVLAEKLNTGKIVIQEEFAKYLSNHQKPTAIQKKLQPTESEVQMFSTMESFVGFLSSHWSFFSNTLMPEGEIAPKILALLTGDAQQVLKAKIYGKELSEAQVSVLRGWELYNDNFYELEPSPENLKSNFQDFVGLLKRQTDKDERTRQAERVKADLAKKSL